MYIWALFFRSAKENKSSRIQVTFRKEKEKNWKKKH